MTSTETRDLLEKPVEPSGRVQQRAAIASWLEALGDRNAADCGHPATELIRQPDQAYEAYEEYWRRKAAGEVVDPDQFCEEHAGVLDSLNCVLRLHEWLEEKEQLSTPDSATNFPAVGETFLGFRLLRELGRGTFARVYLAAEKALGDRHVVVKVSEDGSAEAKMLGRIKHENIVPVFSVQRDEARGLSAVCMPYVGSATLCDVLVRVKSFVPATSVLTSLEAGAPDQAELPAHSPLRGEIYLDGVRVVGAQLADALRCIHTMGIYHRDLKPSNVLITEDDRPMLLDFNLSVDARASAARVAGTLPYMSPEQLQALKREPGTKRKPFDPRSDLYSLGVILYELATGRHPFGAVSASLKVSEAQPMYLELQRRGATPSRQLNPGLSADVAALIDRCLEFDLEKRPANAAELTKALQREKHSEQHVRRRKPWLTAAAACLVLASACTGAAWWSQLETQQTDHWEQGQQAYRETDYTSAIDYFSLILAKEPTRHDVLVARARAYMKLGETHERYYSLASADLFQACNPQSDGEAAAGLGYCILKTKTTVEEARVYFEQAISKAYKTAETHNNLAFCLIQRAEYRDAETHIVAALRHNQGMQAALYNRAILRLRQAGKVVPPTPGMPLSAQAKAQEAQCKAWLQQGKTDLLVVAGIGPETPNLNRDLAHLWALSACYTPEDIEDAFKFLKKAVETGGWDPTRVAADRVLFGALVNDPRFKQIVALPKIAPPNHASMRILNPMQR